MSPIPDNVWFSSLLPADRKDDSLTNGCLHMSIVRTSYENLVSYEMAYTVDSSESIEPVCRVLIELSVNN